MQVTGRQGNAPHQIRIFGDPVLKIRCPEIIDIDASLVQLARDMVETMRAAHGVGLAAPQIGVQKRMFVYDDGHGVETIINPIITNTSGEWTYDEGCLSVPGLFFSITRPDVIVLKGIDLEGNEVEYETSQFQGRIFQHELDHLDGKLLLERLDPQMRKQAMRKWREREMKNG